MTRREAGGVVMGRDTMIADCAYCLGSGEEEDGAECSHCWGHGTEERACWLDFDAPPGPDGGRLVSTPLGGTTGRDGYTRSYIGRAMYLVRSAEGRFVEIEDDDGASLMAGTWSRVGEVWRLTVTP